MDLKGKSWVGSIYHKFEAICQEVDDFVSKDTMKYVENQVQSIGVSVKRLYSDGVQDEILPLKYDMKPGTQAVIGKQADVRDHDTPISSNMTESNLDEKQLPVERGSSDILKKCDTSQRSDVSLVTSPTMTHRVDFFQETNAGVLLKEEGETMIWYDSGEGVEEKNSKVVIFNPSSKNKVLSITSDEESHCEFNTILAMACSPSLSVHETELLVYKQGSTCYSFSDEAEYFLDVSSNGWLSEGVPLFLEFSLGEDKSLPEPLGASAKGHQHDSPPMDSMTLLACNAAKKPSRTCETLHNSFSTKDELIMTSNAVQSPELVFSYCSCDNGKEDRSVISSSRCTHSTSLNLLDSASANYSLTAENTCNLPVGSNGFNHHISIIHACSPSSETVSNEIKAVDMLPPLSIIKSYDYNVSTTHGSVPVVSSESQHQQCYNGAQSTLLMSPSKSGISCLDFGDLNIERIQLSTYRQKNFRYYKKLLKDAFSSRKRLSKGYEHLAILHEDANMDSKNLFEPTSLPPSTASLNMARSRPSHNISDSDWEVL